MKSGKDKLAYFKSICAKSPLVFAKWFRERFSTPHNWYEARNAYMHTAADMSIVGYILGLGDRHCENILLDMSTGEVCHVDYDAVFNKLES